jgi:hypothetical protein
VTLRHGCLAALALAAQLPAPLPLPAQVPKPVDVHGFEPGADYKIADYGQGPTGAPLVP